MRIAQRRTLRYRNPVIFAMELQAELITDHLTRQKPADIHGISLERVIQWQALLELPSVTLVEIAGREDWLYSTTANLPVAELLPDITRHT